MHRRRLLAMLPAAALASAWAADDPWTLLAKGGYVVLMRHAATDPGIGDPPGFKLGACSTQRNLSAAGRQDAARLGAAFRAHGVPVAEVLSSHWCRCTDTAQLAFGRVKAVDMLDSMFQDDDVARRRKLAALRDYLKAYAGKGNLVLVTHDVNIRALVGKYVEQGDLVVARVDAEGKLAVAATLPVAAQ